MAFKSDRVFVGSAQKPPSPSLSLILPRAEVRLLFSKRNVSPSLKERFLAAIPSGIRPTDSPGASNKRTTESLMET